MASPLGSSWTQASPKLQGRQATAGSMETLPVAILGPEDTVPSTPAGGALILSWAQASTRARSPVDSRLEVLKPALSLTPSWAPRSLCFLSAPGSLQPLTPHPLLSQSPRTASAGLPQPLWPPASCQKQRRPRDATINTTTLLTYAMSTDKVAGRPAVHTQHAARKRASSGA